jgi:Invasion associated locus B (IalB) protein
MPNLSRSFPRLLSPWISDFDGAMTRTMILHARRILPSLIGLTMAGAAHAAEPQSLGSFSDWNAYTYKAADTKVCYIVSQPKSSASTKKNSKRDPVFFIVTNMPGRKIAGEVSTIIGYPFKEQSIAQVKVDEAAFKLFTKADGAWAEGSEVERQIVTAMKGGKKLTVSGTSWKGTQTTDTYSLAGLSAALDKINSACK